MTVTGNVVFWLLLAVFLVALVIYFERLFDLRRAQIDFRDFLKGLENILRSGRVDEALAICDETPSPFAAVASTAIRHADGSARVLREAVDAQGRAEVGRLDRRLAALAIIAQIAPLLGLLGTVIGMIKTVLLVDAEEIVSRADLLNGAMESLVAAALGLAVAIPASIMYGSLRVRLDRMTRDLEAAASQMIGFLSERKEASRA